MNPQQPTALRQVLTPAVIELEDEVSPGAPAASSALHFLEMYFQE
jgi:hypothetical protein